MSHKIFKTVALSTALLLSTTGIAAYAAQVSVGGVSASVGGGGVSANVGGAGGGGALTADAMWNLLNGIEGSLEVLSPTQLAKICLNVGGGTGCGNGTRTQLL